MQIHPNSPRLGGSFQPEIWTSLSQPEDLKIQNPNTHGKHSRMFVQISWL